MVVSEPVPELYELPLFQNMPLVMVKLPMVTLPPPVDALLAVENDVVDKLPPVVFATVIVPLGLTMVATGLGLAAVG